MRQDDGTKLSRSTNQSTGVRNINIDGRTGRFVVKITRNKKQYKQYFGTLDEAKDAKLRVINRYLSGEPN